MPHLPKRPCRYPGCKGYAAGRLGYCQEHEKQLKQSYEINRETAIQRGYTHRWKQARDQWLEKHPLCKICEGGGRVERATEVDHIVPHKGNMELFWDSENNWQSLCNYHHSQKTGREHGFGAR